MSTILSEPITQTSSRPHSISVVGGSQVCNLSRHFEQVSLVLQPCPLKRSSHSMQTSLQTPPPTPRRHRHELEGSTIASQLSPTRNYPRHLSFPIPRRFAAPDERGHYMTVEDKLEEYSPDFAGVPVDYVRQTVRKRGKKWYDFVVRASTNSSVVSTKTKNLELDSDMMSPTHILVVYPLTPPSNWDPELHPVHSLIPTIYCANLPPFPKNDDPSKLPHLPIRLPHPPSFKLLLHFLYTRDIQNIISYLLPVPWSSRRHHDYVSHPTLPVPISLSALAGYARGAFGSLSTEDRYLHLDLFYGVYSNVVALGLYDLPLQGARDADADVGTARKSVDNPSGRRQQQHDVEYLSVQWESIILRDGSQDVDGRLLCLCLIALWEALCKT